MCGGLYSAARSARRHVAVALSGARGASRLGLFNPYLMLVAVALGAVGVSMALPRKGLSPQALGALVAGLALGLGMVAIGVRSGGELPPIYFYVFALIGLGASLRVITHPRPVYAALYFILTILSSAGLFLLLSAEFLTFALVIIYAGAILITYLFVIMLATEAPTAEAIEALKEYDRTARAPVGSVVAGFVLLGALTGLWGKGLPTVPPSHATDGVALLEKMPRKVERALVEREGLPGEIEVVSVVGGSAEVVFPDGWGGNEKYKITRPIEKGESMSFPVPEGLTADNVELVGMALVGEHPLGLELAGVILLMAMLGAVVLARKQIQIEEGHKAEATLKVATGPGTGVAS